MEMVLWSGWSNVIELPLLLAECWWFDWLMSSCNATIAGVAILATPWRLVFAHWVLEVQGTQTDLDGPKLTSLSMALNWKATLLPCSLSHRLVKLVLHFGYVMHLNLPRFAPLLQMCTGLKTLVLNFAATAWNGLLDPLAKIGLTR